MVSKSGGFGLPCLPLLCLQCQPGKENHTEVTGCQVAQAERAAGKISLGKFLESDQEGKDQANDNGDPRSALKRDRTEESQVDEQSQNSVKDEMSCFVSKWNPIDSLKNAELAKISQNNNENNKEREEDGKPLHKKRDALERLFHFASFFCSDFTPRFQRFPNGRDNGNENDGYDDKFKIFLNEGDIAKEKSQ